MTNQNETLIHNYWQAFQQATGLSNLNYSSADQYGYGKAMGDYLAQLIADGTKTATCSAIELYEDDEPVPQVGDYNIILDGDGNPACITKTEVVETIPFDQVSAEHAYHEGERDRSLTDWRNAHRNFFTKEYQAAGKQFNEQIPCLCEVFKVIYK